MLDPSSSEEEADEVVEEERKVVAAPKAGGPRVSSSRTSEGSGGLQPSQSTNARPTSPSPSVAIEKEKDDLEKMQREEEERKKRLQLYVFVMRCIAYPFNAKQPTDMARRQQKVSGQSRMQQIAVQINWRMGEQQLAVEKHNCSVEMIDSALN